MDTKQYKTKEQKEIEKLKAALSKKEKENAELIIEKKRLTYANEQLKKLNEKLALGTYKSELKKLTERCERNERFKVKQSELIQTLTEKIKRMNEYAYLNDFSRKRLESFIGGLETDIDGFRLYDQKTLIADVNLLDGHWLSCEVHKKIKERLKNNEYYKQALERCKPYLKAAEEGDIDALDFLNNEMWLLYREYYDIIIGDYEETFFSGIYEL